MKPYVPINCNFYDELEALAVRRQPCEIVFNEGEGEQTVTGIIADLWNAEKVEYLRLDNGKALRLDHLVSVDGKRPSLYC